jgi:hypothetical protein
MVLTTTISIYRLTADNEIALHTSIPLVSSTLSRRTNGVNHRLPFNNFQVVENFVPGFNNSLGIFLPNRPHFHGELVFHDADPEVMEYFFMRLDRSLNFSLS